MKIAHRCTRKAALALLPLLVTAHAHAEDGYDLWLRYHPVTDEAARAHYREAASEIVTAVPASPMVASPMAASQVTASSVAPSPVAVPSVSDSLVAAAGATPANMRAGTPSTLGVAQAELLRGLSGLLATREPVNDRPTRNGSIVFGTPKSSAVIAKLNLPLTQAGSEGYVIRTVRYDGHRIIVIAGNTDAGVLYGTFHFLRLIQTQQSIDALEITEAPRVQLRIDRKSVV